MLEKRQKKRKKRQKTALFLMKLGAYIAPLLLKFGYISSENGGKRLLYTRRNFKRGNPHPFWRGQKVSFSSTIKKRELRSILFVVGQLGGGGSLDGAEDLNPRGTRGESCGADIIPRTGGRVYPPISSAISRAGDWIGALNFRAEPKFEICLRKSQKIWKPFLKRN